MFNKETIESCFKELQDEICKGLENADGKAKFEEDFWEREAGGGGRTRVIKKGNVIEKGGVNFSAVFGPCPKFLKNEIGMDENDNADFYATGVSLVIHPGNPFVPIIHTNVRYLEAGNVQWFGGGIDLTPHYIDEEDARFFHSQLKKVCDEHNPIYYPKFKEWADNYFFIEHRNETRGIGGIFFDGLAPQPPVRTGTGGPEGGTKGIGIEERFKFVQAVGNSFLKIYLPLIDKNRKKEYTEANKQWQYLRRGRYVEFNLVYDRGTKFGLKTKGRTESILMSLPPMACWEYSNTPEKGSLEEKTLGFLKKGVEWVGKI